MFSKEQKSKILERFVNSDEKILISNVLDKAYRFEKTDKLEYTSFLNQNEYKLISSVLNETHINYLTFSMQEKLTRKIIFFVPEYINLDNEFDALFSKVISVIKIVPNKINKFSKSNKLTHKDYMGAIYSLGLKHEIIGDIFCTR